MRVKIGERDLEFGRELGELRDCNTLLNDTQALRARLAEDGYLLVRGLHPRDKVLAARAAILEFMRANGDAVLPGTDLMDGVINPAARPVRLMGNPAITHDPRVLAVLEGAPIFVFFENFFGEAPRTFDYKWLRQVDAGGFTGAHFDNVYMSRGSTRLLTCWTPLGDIPIEQGTLCICEGSHNLPAFARMRETYGQMDVDRDRVDGWFSNDPMEITRKFGGMWKTAEFRAGDVMIFPMFTLHGSTNNTTARWRLSCDTRFQPAADPVDERWIGAQPKGHYAWYSGATKPMATARAEWGV
jgi:hypothetical protein